MASSGALALLIVAAALAWSDGMLRLPFAAATTTQSYRVHATPLSVDVAQPPVMR
jgi:hypothetical protein